MNVNVNIEEIILTSTEMTIDGVTLLSIEEYEKYKKNIPLLKDFWWLRTRGNSNTGVMGVKKDGSVDHYGFFVYADGVHARPVLKISNHNLKIKDEFEFKNYKWTVISEKLAICNTSIGYFPFRKNWREEDMLDYNVSDVKTYIEDWLSEEYK